MVRNDTKMTMQDEALGVTVLDALLEYMPRRLRPYDNISFYCPIRKFHNHYSWNTDRKYRSISSTNFVLISSNKSAIHAVSNLVPADGSAHFNYLKYPQVYRILYENNQITYDKFITLRNYCKNPSDNNHHGYEYTTEFARNTHQSVESAIAELSDDCASDRAVSPLAGMRPRSAPPASSDMRKTGQDDKITLGVCILPEEPSSFGFPSTMTLINRLSSLGGVGTMVLVLPISSLDDLTGPMSHRLVARKLLHRVIILPQEVSPYASDGCAILVLRVGSGDDTNRHIVHEEPASGDSRTAEETRRRSGQRIPSDFWCADASMETAECIAGYDTDHALRNTRHNTVISIFDHYDFRNNYCREKESPTNMPITRDKFEASGFSLNPRSYIAIGNSWEATETLGSCCVPHRGIANTAKVGYTSRKKIYEGTGRSGATGTMGGNAAEECACFHVTTRMLGSELRISAEELFQAARCNGSPCLTALSSEDRDYYLKMQSMYRLSSDTQAYLLLSRQAPYKARLLYYGHRENHQQEGGRRQPLFFTAESNLLVCSPRGNAESDNYLTLEYLLHFFNSSYGIECLNRIANGRKYLRLEDLLDMPLPPSQIRNAFAELWGEIYDNVLEAKMEAKRYIAFMERRNTAFTEKLQAALEHELGQGRPPVETSRSTPARSRSREER